MWKAAEYVTKGGVDYAAKLLTKSLGPELAKRVLDSVVKSFASTRAFTGLEKADPQQLSKFIQSEHPQTIALILAHLKPGPAAQLMQSLPEDLRVEVVTRMANLEEISPEVISRISSVIEQRLKSLGASTHESYGGVRAVAELLNRIDDTIIFHQLGTAEITRIVDIVLEDVAKRLAERGLSFQLTQPAREFLAQRGYDPNLGARPLRRAVQPTTCTSFDAGSKRRAMAQLRQSIAATSALPPATAMMEARWPPVSSLSEKISRLSPSASRSRPSATMPDMESRLL